MSHTPPALRRPAPRSRRAGSALALCLLALVPALSACGKEDASAPADPSGLATVKSFTGPQAEAIERVYTEALRLEAKGGAAKRRTRKGSDAAIAPVLRACGGLDGKHPLMSELFRSCAGEGSFLRATADLQRCTNPDTCSEAYMAQKAALRAMAAADRRADRAVRATALPPACKQVLITPDSSYAAFQRVEAALQKIINALESQSRRDRLRAARSARSFKAPSRSTQQQLEAFSANCR